MNQLIELHGKPESLRLNNGGELTSHAFQDWARERGIALRFTQPGKPNQNAYIKRLNKTYREEVPSKLVSVHKSPKYLRSDNGPEFESRPVSRWLHQADIDTTHDNPGKPWRTATTSRSTARTTPEQSNS